MKLRAAAVVVVFLMVVVSFSGMSRNVSAATNGSFAGSGLASASVSIPGVSSYRVLHFDAAKVLDEATSMHQFSVDLGRKTVTIAIKPTILINPRARFYDASGQISSLDLSTIRTFEGRIIGTPDSSVAVTFSAGWFSMMVRSGTDVTEVEPLKQWDRNSDSQTYVVYDSSNVQLTGNLSNDTVFPPTSTYSETASLTVSSNTPSTSQTTGRFASQTGLVPGDFTQQLSMQGSSASGQSSNKSSGTPKDSVYKLAYLEITVDPQYQSAYSDWVGAVLTTVNDVNSILKSQASVDLQMLELRVWSGDSSVTDGWQLLNDYRAWITANANGFDIAHLFSGKTLDNGLLGISFIRGVGSSYAEALTEQVAGNGMDGSEFQRMILVAHEMGHNFNGVHEQATQVNSKWTIMCCSAAQGGFQGSNYNTFYSDGSTDHTLNNKQRITRWAWAVLPHVIVVADGLPDTSGDGVQLASFDVVAPDPLTVLAVVTSQFTYINTNNFDMTFSSPGVFTGCRDASSINKDFGYSGTITLKAHYQLVYTGSRQLDSSGTWQFWPAYYYNSHWGPYQWHMQTRTAYYVVGQTATPTLTYDGTLPKVDVNGPRAGSGLAFYFYLLSLQSKPTKGSTIYAYSTMFWTDTTSPSINYYFVAGRDANFNNKDFGWTGSFYPSPRAHTEFNDVDSHGNPQPGGGATIYYGSRTLDSTGSWHFWTVYYYNYLFNNFADDIYITV